MRKNKSMIIYISDELKSEIERAFAKAVLYSGYKGNKQDFLRACISGGLRFLDTSNTEREAH